MYMYMYIDVCTLWMQQHDIKVVLLYLYPHILYIYIIAECG